MTLTSGTVKVQYNGTGSQTVFTVTFVFWDLDDPSVVHRDADGNETAWVRGTHYDMTGGEGTTGTLTVDVDPTDYTPASGTTLTISSALSKTQDTDLPEGGAFPSTAVEQQMDKIVRMVQERSEEVDRSLHFPTSDAAALSAEIPNSTDRASKYLAFNSSGVPIVNVSPGLEFVSSNAITTSTTLRCPASGDFVAGYDYTIVLEAFAPTSDGQILRMLFSDDGTNFETDSADYQWGVHHTVFSDDVSDAEIQVTGGETWGNDSNNTSTIEFNIINPNASSEQTTAFWRGMFMNADPTPQLNPLTGGARFIQGTDAVKAIQFLWSGGSTFKEQGDINIYRRIRS